MTKDACNRSRGPDGGGIDEFDFDIAEAGARPPRGDVVGGPDKGVDEVEDVEEGDPEDERGSGEVAAFDVCGEGGNGEEDGEEGKDGDYDSGRGFGC